MYRRWASGYETSGWNGIGAPKGTPAEIIDKLNSEINAGLASLKARFADLSVTALAGTPADFGKFIAEETEKWGKVIKFAGIKPEWGRYPTGRYSINIVPCICAVESRRAKLSSWDPETPSGKTARAMDMAFEHAGETVAHLRAGIADHHGAGDVGGAILGAGVDQE
jgi:hypothetical protein